MKQQILVSLASGNVKDFFFFHLNALFKSLLGKKSDHHLVAITLLCEWGQFNKTDWCPLLVSRMTTASLPIKSFCMPCFVQTAALPYVSLQAIYSKIKKRTNKPGPSVFDDRAHSQTHHYPLWLSLKHHFFFVKNLLQVCGEATQHHRTGWKKPSAAAADAEQLVCLLCHSGANKTVASRAQ